MPRKVAIIGIGHVGATVAHYIIADHFADELVLIDTNEAKVIAEATDFQDAMANLPHYTKIKVNDYAALANADIVISAVGNIQLQDNTDDDRFAELPFTRQAARSVAEKIKESGFHGKMIIISNPVDVITSIFQEVTGLPQKHVIGTGTLLDSARMKRAVSTTLGLDPRSITGYNLGEHGNSQFTAWSTVRALGRPMTQVAQMRGLDLESIKQESILGGDRVFHAKKYTNYGIATAAVRLMNAILTDAHSQLVVSNFRPEYATYLSYPAIIGADGIVAPVQLDLTKDELAKLQVSADFIQMKVTESLNA